MDMRLEAVKLIKEASATGARIHKACETLDISTSTFERWRCGKISDNRGNCSKVVARNLSKEEEAKIIEISCSNEYKDDNPYKIHASLLSKGIYIASVSSFYRVLKKNRLIHHRGNTRPGTSHSRPPERVATGPNQVWCWDIAWLPTHVRGPLSILVMNLDKMCSKEMREIEERFKIRRNRIA